MANVSRLSEKGTLAPQSANNQWGDSSLRILVVNDSEQFRELVSVILAMRQNVRVVGEASNGSEAVQKAVDLKPDLIILDIDPPKIDGIEAARQILESAPESKIILLGAEPSAAALPEALSLGVCGYVKKMSVVAELLAVVDTVLRGNHVTKEGAPSLMSL